MGGVVKSIARVAAPEVGGIAVDPGGAALRVALGGLFGGSNRHNILRNMTVEAATSGLGAYLGNQQGTSSNAYDAFNRSQSMPLDASTQVTSPGFEELKAAAVAKTQQVFEEEGVNVFNNDSPYRRIRRESEIDIYNYSKFMPWKKLIKEASKKRSASV